MGRVFVIELEGPMYTCKECYTHLGVRSDIIAKNGPHEYNFSRLFNTFLVETTSDSAFQNIFCVVCSKNIGLYGVNDPNSYWVMRGELHGPEGSDDEV